MKTDKYTNYMNMVMKTMFGQPESLDYFDGFNLDDLITVLRKNRFTVRWLEKTYELHRAQDKVKIKTIIDEEKERLHKAMEMTVECSKEFERQGLNFIVIKSLDNNPDLGHDIDIYSDAPMDKIHDIYMNTFKAVWETPSIPEKIADKMNYCIKGHGTFEIHISKLGEVGEDVELARDIIKNTRTKEVHGYPLKGPNAEFQVLLMVLQRIYRHFNIRLCDVYNTVNLVQDNKIDWDYLRKVSRSYGVWEGVKLYFSYVNKLVSQYGITLNIEEKIEGKSWPTIVRDYNMHYRFPLFMTALNVYIRKVVSDLSKFNLKGLFLMTLIVPLALTHFVSVKLFGKSRAW